MAQQMNLQVAHGTLITREDIRAVAPLEIHNWMAQWTQSARSVVLTDVSLNLGVIIRFEISKEVVKLSKIPDANNVALIILDT